MRRNPWYARRDGRRPAVPRRPLRRRGRPAADLVAPPYDAVSAEERAALYTRSPYNVVHLTLNESADDGGPPLPRLAREGVLVQDEEPAVWLAREEYVGPDGVARERHGVLASLRGEPYDDGTVLPHERTHPHIRESGAAAARDARAARADLPALRRPLRSPLPIPRLTSTSAARGSGGSTAAWPPRLADRSC